jgi:hypothetical protein
MGDLKERMRQITRELNLPESSTGKGFQEFPLQRGIKGDVKNRV